MRVSSGESESVYPEFLMDARIRMSHSPVPHVANVYALRASIFAKDMVLKINVCVCVCGSPDSISKWEGGLLGSSQYLHCDAAAAAAVADSLNVRTPSGLFTFTCFHSNTFSRGSDKPNTIPPTMRSHSLLPNL